MKTHMNKITFKHLIFFMFPLLAVGCEEKMNTKEATFFSGKVMFVKENGYAVDFDENRSDVFDLAIIAMDKPKRLEGKELELVLDTDKKELFEAGKNVSFKVPSVFVNDYFEGLEEGSSFNVLYASYAKELNQQ